MVEVEGFGTVLTQGVPASELRVGLEPDLLATAELRVAIPVNPEIREMKIEDLDRVVGLLRSDENLAFLDQEADLLRSALINPAGSPGIMTRIMVDQGTDELIGVALGTAGFRGHLSHFIIANPYRGREMGNRLLDDVVAWFKEKGCPRIILTLTADNNNPGKARGFYERAGFAAQPGEVSLEMDIF